VSEGSPLVERQTAAGMDGVPPLRGWKKRWTASAAALLILAYPATEGPMSYAMARGWLPHSTYDSMYALIWAGIEDSRLERPHDRYVWWWETLGYRHEGYVVKNRGGTPVLSKSPAGRFR
jgi:hypothetical protein